MSTGQMTLNKLQAEDCHILYSCTGKEGIHLLEVQFDSGVFNGNIFVKGVVGDWERLKDKDLFENVKQTAIRDYNA